MTCLLLLHESVITMPREGGRGGHDEDPARHHCLDAEVKLLGAREGRERHAMVQESRDGVRHVIGAERGHQAVRDKLATPGHDRTGERVNRLGVGDDHLNGAALERAQWSSHLRDRFIRALRMALTGRFLPPAPAPAPSWR